jgi:hypothetical protein
LFFVFLKSGADVSSMEAISNLEKLSSDLDGLEGKILDFQQRFEELAIKKAVFFDVIWFYLKKLLNIFEAKVFLLLTFNIIIFPWIIAFR